jgi:hypothetical protein
LDTGALQANPAHRGATFQVAEHPSRHPFKQTLRVVMPPIKD